MNPFEKKFMLMLEEDENLPPAPPSAVLDGPGLDGDLDSTISAVDDVQDNPGVSWRKDQNNSQRATIQSWISKVGDFTEFLNGMESESIQKQLANADCDTLFADVGRSETKKITRIAQDLSALQESLKGYLISTDDE
tara:strand:+ start:1851 stop:2261 length:411 start_codon:yes stop_codon:yes gene_type:complete